MDLLSLVAKLSLDSSEYEKGLGDAETKGSTFGRGLKKAAAVGASAVAAVGTAAIAAGTALVKGTGDVAVYGDNIDKMSQKMGISARAYQEWDAIMQHSGTSIDALKPSMKMLAMQAEKGNDAFQKLGISEKEVASLSQEDLFAKVITGLQGMEEGTERTYITSQLLGRGATELGALLNTSAEETQKMRDRVHELGGVMSDDAVKAAAAYQDSLQDMRTGFDSLKRNMLSEFLPTITSVMDGLTNLFTGNYDEGIERISEGVGQAIDKFSEMLPKIGNAIIQYLPVIIQTGIQVVKGFISGMAQAIPQAIETAKGMISNFAQGIFGSAWESIKTSVQTAIEGISESFDILVTAFEPITNAVDGVIEKFQEWIDSGDALNEATELFSTGIELVGKGISLFLEGLASVIDYGVQFTEWLMSGSDGADAFMAVLTGIATIIALVTANMAAHAIAAGAYQVAMMAVQGVTNLVAGAQAALNAVMAANPIGIVVVAIAALVAALVYLYNNNETVRAGIDAAWQAIKTAVEVAIEGIRAALYAIGEFIVTTWETVTSAVETAMNIISTVVSTYWNAIGTLISTVLTIISTTITTIWSAITSTISTTMDNIKNKITTIWTTIKTSITNVITLIKSTVTNGFTTMVSNLAAPLTNMKNAITGAFNSVKNTIKGVIDSAVKWGSDLIDNFVSGIKNNISKVGDAIGGVADKIKSLIGFSEPEDGPLSRFHTFAPDMMKLFAQGIDQSAYLVTDALKRNFDFYDDIVKPLNIDGSASSGLIGSRSGDFNETINIYAPTALDPSEVARQTRKANREMMLALRGI